MWTRCCIARVVRNSESLRGLHRRSVEVEIGVGSFTVAMALSRPIVVWAYRLR